MAGERRGGRRRPQREVLDVQTVASIGQGRGRRERDALAAALSGEAGEFETRRRPAEEPAARREREAARVPAQVEIARRRAARRRQLDAGDRLPADFGARELGEPGDDLRAPEVGDLEVDLEAFEPIRVDGHPVAVRRDREHCLPSATEALAFAWIAPVSFVRTSGDRSSRLAALKLKSPVASVSAPTASAPASRAEARLSAKIVDRPAAVAVLCDMRRALERMAVDIAGQGRVRVDEAGHVIGERFERDAGRLAVEELPSPKFAFSAAVRSEGAPLSAPAISALPLTRGSRNMGLRNLDARAEIHLVASVLPVEPRGPMLAARQKIGEAEPAARRQPRGAGQVERSAGRPIEHRIIRGEFRRMRVEGRAQRAVSRRAVQIGGDARFALERAAREQRETAQVARNDIRLAMNFAAREKAGILGVEIGRREVEDVERRLAFQRPSRAS